MCSFMQIPEDKINVRLILLNGSAKEFICSPGKMASEITQHVYDFWMEEWQKEGISKPETLRLIYQGRFVPNKMTLAGLGLPLGKTAVLHLVTRENLHEPKVVMGAEGGI